MVSLNAYTVAAVALFATGRYCIASKRAEFCRS